MKRLQRLLVASLVGTLAQVPIGGGILDALTYPTSGMSNMFPACGDAAQEFCIESTGFTADGGGAEVPIKGSAAVHIWFAEQYNGPSTAGDANGFMPRLNMFVCPTVTANGCFEGPATQEGLAKGTYRVKVRLGDYDPTYTIFKGLPASNDHFVVEKGTDGYYTVQFSLKPQPHQMVYTASKVSACAAAKWGDGCTHDIASRSFIGSIMIMSSVASTRDRERGFWIATSASFFNLNEPTRVGEEYRQSFTVAGPHFVPSDFGPTAKAEGGKYLYPAFYQVFNPYTSVKPKVEAFLATQNITANVDKSWMDQHILNSGNPLFAGKIKDPLGADVAANLTVNTTQLGVHIDFNLSTFSAPNPTLIMRNPLRKTTELKGANFAPLTIASSGRTYTANVLVAPTTGTKVKSLTSTTTKVCSVKGSAVRMSRAGDCKLRAVLTVTSKVGKKVQTKTVTTSMSLTVN